jgi:hypothetical protein
MTMEAFESRFEWNDGGRSACGYIGLTGDCVTRSIAIATGIVYRDVYQALGAAAGKSPRLGMNVGIANEYLMARQWKRFDGNRIPFEPAKLHQGVVVAHIARYDDKCHHMCAVIEGVVHDTWDPSLDYYELVAYWICESAPSDTQLPSIAPFRARSRDQVLTQEAFDKILGRLRALDRTASNGGSTEAEKHNALRMMQDLMLRHNLSREDIVDESNLDNVLFSRVACPVNGSRICMWERRLADYVAEHIFTTTQHYSATKSKRTWLFFYGPKSDVENAIALFQELLVTIATAAKLQFGGYSRGSGASYAEGYVAGLPKASNASSAYERPRDRVLQEGLIQHRTLAMHRVADDWLDLECNTKLVVSSTAGRDGLDPLAKLRGELDGAQHKIDVPNAPRRLTAK